MSCLSLIVNSDIKVIEFIRILNFCKNTKTENLYLNLRNFGTPDSINLKKKLKFIYSAFYLEGLVSSGSQIYLTENSNKTFDELNSFSMFKSENSSKFNSSENYHEINSDDVMTKNFEEIKLPYKHSNVVLGGTFDRLHNGHRLFLSICTFLAQFSINIGITSDQMIKSKVLSQLIQTYEIRTQNVFNYIKNLKPDILVRFDMLNEPTGFSATEISFETLVTTFDNFKVSSLINNARKDKSLPPLENFVLDKVYSIRSNDRNSTYQLSSTHLRCLEMGKNLRKIRKPVSFPYIIGVTGSMGSGKTSLCQYIKKLGAYLIDCDQEAKESYLPGKKCYFEIINAFGEEILDKNFFSSNRVIDRKMLGKIVFNDYSKMDILNSIVWPHLLERVKLAISAVDAEKGRIILIDATILYESHLDDLVHEVWLCVVPEKISLNRIRVRNMVDHERAKVMYDCTERIITSFEKSKKCDVIFSTHMEIEKTQEVISNTWESLKNRINI